MTAPEVYKSIATDGLTDHNRAAFQALPNAERLGLYEALKQDFPDIARDLKQGLPDEDEASAGDVNASQEQSQGAPLGMDEAVTATTSNAPIDSIQDEQAHHDPVEPGLGVTPEEPSKPKSGKIPPEFPGAAKLADHGISTFAQLRKEVKSYQHLTHIDGIGDSTDAQILKALEE